LVLLVGSGICLLFGVAGIIVGALRTTQEPLIFLMLSVEFLLVALWLRRDYQRYEAEVLPLAAEDLKAERDAKSPDPNAHQ
jgi:hypothetical protein